MNKSFKLFASAALSLAVAGTCLAAPAFAAGDSSALGGALDAVARAAEQAGAEQAPAAPGVDESDTLISLGTHINFAGIAFDVPEGYTDDEDPSDDVLSVTNESGTVSMSVYYKREVVFPADTDWASFFSSLAQISVAGYEGSTVEELGADELGEGTMMYAYGLVVPDGDDTYIIVQLYVLTAEGGFTFMQMGYSANDVTDEDTDELTEVIDSLKLAEDDGLDIDDLGTSSCGFTFDLPEGLVPYEDEDYAWIDENGDILIMTMGHVVEGATELTSEDYAALYEALTPEGDSPESKVTLLDRDVVDGKNGLVSAYSSYEVADPDETVYAVVIVTPVLEDDSVSVMIVWCSEQGAAKYGEAIFDMMESFDKE